MSEIKIDEAASAKLLELQQFVAQSQAKIIELAVVLAAYGAVPKTLENAVRQLAESSESRDEQIKAIAAASGIDLDDPSEAGKWSWSPQDALLKRAE